MAHFSAPVTDDPDEERCIYRRTVNDLPQDVLGTSVVWISPPPHPGYYLFQVEDDPEPVPVEFIDNYWYELIYRPGSDTWWSSSSKRIARNEEGTGFWSIQDQNHPDYHQQTPIDAPREQASSPEHEEGPEYRFIDPHASDHEEGPSYQSAISQAPDPELQFETEVVTTQLELGLDIREREPANPADPSYPAY